MNFARKSGLNAKEVKKKLADVDTDDSDAGSEYEDEHISDDESFEFDDDDDVELVDSDEVDMEADARKIDEAIEMAIQRAIGDQSVREFPVTADKSSKAGVVWTKINLDQTKRVVNQVKFSGKPGPTAYAARRVDSSALSAFQLIIDKSITDTIVNSTNREAENNNDSFRISYESFYLFIAVLLCRGVFCSGVAVRDLWSRLYGIPIISELMSKSIFCKIMKFIRFDDKKTRSSRKSNDKFCLIREIWDRFIENSQMCYIPGQFVTIDEQLLPSKSKCPFIQFIASKPDKFGIKFWFIVDVDSKYLVNGFPYLGKESDKEAGVLQGEFAVKKLIQPYENFGHCVCTDNFFTSLTLAIELLKKKTNLIGTIKRNKRELPSVVNSKQPIYDSLVYEHDTGVLLNIYQGKQDKNVSLISSFHDSVYVEPEDYFLLKKKTNVVHDYNSKKVGVDLIDQMAKFYSVKAPTRRWPMQVFYNIINLACINSWILYKSVNKSNISRRDFLIKLIEEIKSNYKKTSIPSSSGTPKSARKRILSQENQENLSPKRVSCQIRLCGNYKATNFCSKCKKPVCGFCTKEIESICKKCD